MRRTGGHIDTCEWFYVYDIIEAFHAELVDLQDAFYDVRPRSFQSHINEYFRRKGIGWQLVDGMIQVRGSEEFEEVVHEVIDTLESAERQTAATEISQALEDLSKRPIPDVTGAIQHALASSECVARDVTGDPRSTLGALLKRHETVVSKPLDSALQQLWGFTSEQGRHLREGRRPGFPEAELAVFTAAAVAWYLSRKADA